MPDRQGLDHIRSLQDDRRNIERMKHDAHGGDQEVIHQTETRCRILGVDGEGWHHVYDLDRERVVVISREGIGFQDDIDRLPIDDLGDWMDHVEDQRGWLHMQWRGHLLARAIRGEMA